MMQRDKMAAQKLSNFTIIIAVNKIKLKKINKKDKNKVTKSTKR